MASEGKSEIIFLFSLATATFNLCRAYWMKCFKKDYRTKEL